VGDNAVARDGNERDGPAKELLRKALVRVFQEEDLAGAAPWFEPYSRSPPTVSRMMWERFLTELAQLSSPLGGPNATCIDWGSSAVRFFSNCARTYVFLYDERQTQFNRATKRERGVVIGDLRVGLPHVPSGLFDLTFCGMVMEHVPPSPLWSGVRTLQRIVKPGGVLVYAIPFLYHYHGVPGDYQRQTLQGVLYLLESNGFDVCLAVSDGHRAALATALGLKVDRTLRVDFFTNQSKRSLLHSASQYSVVARRRGGDSVGCAALPDLTAVTNGLSRAELKEMSTSLRWAPPDEAGFAALGA